MEPSIIHAGPFLLRFVDYAPCSHQADHSHDMASVSLVLAGDIRETTSAGEATGSALSICVKPAGVRHADDYGRVGARTFQISVASEMQAAFSEVHEFRRGFWMNAGRPTFALLDIARLVSNAGDRVPNLENRVRDAILAVEDAGKNTSQSAGWVGIVREMLDNEWDSEASLEQLARRAGTHPVSASRAFKRTFGLTVTEYRRRLRLRRAAARMTDSTLSLSQVAHNIGFSDHAHLCREFKSLLGITPSELRKLGTRRNGLA